MTNSIWSPKHPDSVEYFTIDFSPQLTNADVLVNAVPPTITLGDTALIITSPTRSGNTLTATFSGGTDGMTYELETVGTSSRGETLVVASRLLVRRRLF